jgi:choline/glycine/proline betaine transport protein
MASSYGNIRLGRNNSKPEYSFFSWISMLFAAGMGIGLMYFSVAEPMQHYLNDIFAYKSPVQRAENAHLYTFFHWEIHAWAIYNHPHQPSEKGIFGEVLDKSSDCTSLKGLI